MCKYKKVQYSSSTHDDASFAMQPLSVDMEDTNLFEIETDETFETSIKLTIKYFTYDISVSLLLAFLVNSMILIVAASAFHDRDLRQVRELEIAYNQLRKNVHYIAATLFAIALLASGLSSTITGTIAGQIVMSGFLDLKFKPWIRRLLTRSLAILPALLTIMIYGEQSLARLLILSQVVLSFQLPFAVLPLIMFTSSETVMMNQEKCYSNGVLTTFIAYFLAFSIIGVNIYNIWLFMSA